MLKENAGRMDIWHHMMRRESFYADNEDDLMLASRPFFSGVRPGTQKNHSRPLSFPMNEENVPKRKEYLIHYLSLTERIYGFHGELPEFVDYDKRNSFFFTKKCPQW